MKTLKTDQKGFTIIELMVSLTIFIIIMMISMGSILGIFAANRKSRSQRAVMNNLNLALESMSKEMRYGENYHCGGGSITLPQNCAEGDTLLSFFSSENKQITYRLNNNAIEKEVDNAGFLPITAPEVVIENLTFYALGAGADTSQPKVLIRIKGYAGVANKGKSDFILETLVSQRVLDI